jgi:hypothetical protein
MINMTRAMKSDRLMKAVTGLTVQEFKGLIGSFTEHLETTVVKIRKVNPSLGRPSKLESPGEKLFYILFYFKCYPTFDLAGLIFDVDRSSCCRWTQWFSMALRLTLGYEMVLPKRKIRSPEELLQRHPGLQAVLVDGTERPRRRPQDTLKQKEHYSGKKKRHTIKNLVTASPDKKILVLSPTREGKAHDYGIFTQEDMGNTLPRDIPILTDLGFEGIEKNYPDLLVIKPAKKPRGGELSEKQKRRNKLISSVRILVEHAIGGVKRYAIVADPYRNLREGFEDLVMEISCGLWNYHLKTT